MFNIFFIGREEGVNIIKEYDKLSLYPMLLKCDLYLQVMVESKLVCAYQIGDVESNLNIFQIIFLLGILTNLKRCHL